MPRPTAGGGIPVLLFLLLAGCSLDNKEKPGALDPYWQVVWAGDIYLEEDHVIGAENSLVIRPGTRVHFGGSGARITLLVFGGLVIQGEPGEEVTFISDNGRTNEIHLLSYPQYSGDSIEDADIADNRLFVTSPLAVSSCRIGWMRAYNTARVTVRKSTIGRLETDNYARLDCRNTEFDRASFPSLAAGDLNLIFSGMASANVENCNILGSSTRPVSSVYVAEDFSGTNIDLSTNYWRTTDAAAIATNLVFNDGFGLLLTGSASGSAYPVR